MPSMWKSSMVVPVPKTRSCSMQDRRVLWHIFGLSGVQGNVFDYPGKACEGGRRKAIIAWRRSKMALGGEEDVEIRF